MDKSIFYTALAIISLLGALLSPAIGMISNIDSTGETSTKFLVISFVFLVLLAFSVLKLVDIKKASKTDKKEK